MRSFILPLAGALGIASALHADVVVSYYNSSSNYHWKCYHMPDFDQKRDNCCGHPGLPGDGGMYCVPTAAMNTFAYAANHGFPWLDPGAANWQLQGHYDEATSRLLQLGMLMGTTAGGGTGGSGWKAGAQIWLNSYGLGFLTCSHYYLNGNYTPRAYKMAKKAVQGSLVEFVYGRYDVIGSIGGVPVVSRTGGHAVTLTDMWNLGNGTVIRYRDPADAPYDAVQSTFVNKEVNAVAIQVIFSGSITPRTVTAIAYPSDDGKIRIIDGFMTLKPIWCLSFQNNGDGLTLSKVNPVGLEGQGSNPVKLATGFAIKDLHLDADGEDAVAIIQLGAATGFTGLQRIDLVTGEQTPLGGFNTLQRCCVGRNGDIYAHDNSKIYRISAEGELISAISSVPSPTAFAYDDANDDLIVLSVGPKRLTRLNSDLSLVSTFNMPTNTPMSGDGSVVVNPFDSKVYCCSDGSNSLFSLYGMGPIFSFETLNVAGLTLPKGIGASDDGKLFVSSNSQLKVLQQTGDGRAVWTFDTDSPFFNQQVAGRISMQTSRTNVDPAIHDTPAWNNILPEQLLDIGLTVPDCLGDIDHDGDTDAGDLARLLGNWGNNDPNSDLDGDGLVGQADLAILLGQWGPCP